MTPCDYFDLGVLVFLVIGSIWSFAIGFVSTLAYILAPLTGIAVACRFRVPLIEWFGWTATPGMEWLMAFVLFALTSLVVLRLSAAVDYLLKRCHLAFLNHLLGLFFGSMLTLVLCWLISYSLICFDKTSPLVSHSRSAKYLLLVAEAGKKTISDLPTSGSGKAGEIIKMPETFIDRVKEERAKAPESVTPDENTGIPKFLDDVDSKLEPIFIPNEKKE